jgi:hypothetical protein
MMYNGNRWTEEVGEVPIVGRRLDHRRPRMAQVVRPSNSQFGTVPVLECTLFFLWEGTVG